MFRLFIPLVFFGFAATLYFGYTQQTLADISSIKRELETISGTLSIDQEKIELKRKELEESRESISQMDRDKLDRVLPSVKTFDEAGFINDMNNIAFRHSMMMEGLSVSGISKDDIQSSTAGQYKKMTISFGVFCTYPAFKQLLYDLEKNEQIFDIKSFSFGEASDTKESNYQIGIDTYYWVPLSSTLIQ